MTEPMKFMRRDFSAVMKMGIILFRESDNPQNEAALRKFIYSFKPFVPDDELTGVMAIADVLDFDTAAAAVCNLGHDEYMWAQEILSELAEAEGQMNDRQQELWDRFDEIYWDIQEPDDDGRFDAYA